MPAPNRRRPRPPRQAAVHRLWDDAMRDVQRRQGGATTRDRRSRRAKGWGIADMVALTITVFALTLIWLNRGMLVQAPFASGADFATETQSALAPENAGAAIETLSRSFTLCHTGGGTNCVVDGDTFWLNGEKIRIADIDTPETHPPRCAAEAALGEQATQRLQALLNAGPITLAANPGGDNYDRYGRRLAVVERGGASIGMMLVSEGLARPYDGGQRGGWC